MSFALQNVPDPVIQRQKLEKQTLPLYEIKGTTQIRKRRLLCTVKEGIAQERDRKKEEDEENERDF